MRNNLTQLNYVCTQTQMNITCITKFQLNKGWFLRTMSALSITNLIKLKYIAHFLCYLKFLLMNDSLYTPEANGIQCNIIQCGYGWKIISQSTTTAGWVTLKSHSSCMTVHLSCTKFITYKTSHLKGSEGYKTSQTYKAKWLTAFPIFFKT